MRLEDMLAERFVIVNELNQFYTGKFDLTWSNDYGSAKRWPMSAWGRRQCEFYTRHLCVRGHKARIAVARPDGTLTE